MNEKKTKFQFALMIFFGILFIIGFILFATYEPNNYDRRLKIDKVVIWGTMDKAIVNYLLKEIKDKDPRFNQVKYVEKSKLTYNQDILEALASGESPDLVLLSNDILLKNLNKIYPIPSANITKRSFLDTYADAFSIYASKEGVLGIPFVIDPMVMYFNRNLLSTNRVVLPPQNWEEFEEPKGITTKIRLLDSDDTILKSAIGFGESINVVNFKEILYTLFMQKDNPIIIEGDKGYESDQNSFRKTKSIIKYYTQFSNQTNKITYSWNKSMQNTERVFLSENLGVYFGFVSEIRKIRLKNPNLNFDVAEIPSFKENQKKTVYARTWVFAIPKPSKNKGGALATAQKFASKDIQKLLTEKVFLPPVRKDLLSETPSDSYMDIFYREAIYANSLFEPGSKETRQVFSEFVSNVNAGLRQPFEATELLAKELDVLLKKYNFKEKKK